MLEHFLKHHFHFHIYFLMCAIGVLLHRINFWKEAWRSVHTNSVFFALVWIVFAIIPLLNSPFQPLVYFDEHNYLLSSQNIVEGGVNALCSLRENGECKAYAVAPHGIGVNPIYALFYDYRFDQFYRKVSFLNLTLYLLNAALMFTIALNLFMSRPIAMAASVLILAMPFNIIYATNVMPETVSNTLFLILIYCLIRFAREEGDGRNRAESDRTNLLLTLLCALLLICSIRIEHMMLLTVFLLWVCPRRLGRIGHLQKDSCPPHKILPQPFLTAWMSGAVLLAYAYAGYYLKNKTLGGAGIGWRYFNSSYLGHYFLNCSFWAMSVLFVIYVGFLLTGSFKREAGTMCRLKIFLVCILFAFILFYSFYNFPSVYRFLIPISSLYILFAAAGMDFLLRAALKKEGRAFWIAGTVFLVCLVVPLVTDSLRWKKRMIMTESRNKNFIKILDKSDLDKISSQYAGESCYFFLAPYLGQVSRIKNYSDDYDWAMQKMKEGKNLFYLENAFQKIGESPFRDPKRFSLFIQNEKPSLYRIYKIEVSDEGTTR